MLFGMLRSGMKVADEPMLKSAFNYMLVKAIMGMKYRQRLYLRDGTVLKGILDEYNLLPYDAVFAHLNVIRGEAEYLRNKY